MATVTPLSHEAVSRLLDQNLGEKNQSCFTFLSTLCNQDIRERLWPTLVYFYALLEKFANRCRDLLKYVKI